MKNYLILKKTVIALLLFLTIPSSNNFKCDDGNTTSPTEKVVYLTFDDGPAAKVTSKVLDVLKTENVPATFFVIGNQIDSNKDIILRMKEEGHSIGLHSYSHDRDRLYSSNEGFMNEMSKVQSKLYEVTGETYTILRFPFGCNNSTYRLSTSLVQTIHSNNLKIYDWTQDTLDGANPNSDPGTIIQRAISNKDTVVVLMHCGGINKNSAAALPGVIKYYKNHGYTFKKITEETPEIYKVTRKNS